MRECYQGSMNKPSSDIYPFLYNLYRQQSIPYILGFPYFCCKTRCYTTKSSTRNKSDSYNPYTSQPTNHPQQPFNYWIIECSIPIGKYRYSSSSSTLSISASPTFSSLYSEERFLLTCSEGRGVGGGYLISGINIFIL